MHAQYGTPPDRLVTVSIFGRPTAVKIEMGQVGLPAGVVQCSPLSPGSAALEELGDGTAESFIVHAPRGTLDRRYVIAQALRVLQPGAPFTILAHRKQGGARIHDELMAFGVTSIDEAKHHHRICTGTRPAGLVGLDTAITDGAPRFVDELQAWSQPGIFSWDRVDPGSALLISHLPQMEGNGADLGCGIGILARALLSQPAVKHVTLIDIDRRAVEMARRNVDRARASFAWADVVTSKALPANLDFVIMNPPFHDGGAEDQNLGRAFIAKAAALLRQGGRCLLVANRHLPYEAAMTPLFKEVTQVVQADGYKIYVATK